MKQHASLQALTLVGALALAACGGSDKSGTSAAPSSGGTGGTAAGAGGAGNGGQGNSSSGGSAGSSTSGGSSGGGQGGSATSGGAGGSGGTGAVSGAGGLAGSGGTSGAGGSAGVGGAATGGTGGMAPLSEVGFVCSQDDECSGPNPECIIAGIKPLEALSNSSEPALADLANNTAVIPLPGNYCSNVAPCVDDMDCGDGGKCFLPLIDVAPDDWEVAVSILPGTSDELDVIRAFRTYGICMRPCTDQTDCDYRQGYVCEVPLGDLVSLAGPDARLETYCIGDPDFGNDCSQCDINANCDDTTSPVTCTCSAGYEGDGFTCTPIMLDCSPTCGTNASCVDDGSGNGVCVCNPGFMGDGFTCTGNTCNPACGANALCNSNFNCQCESGYEGDPIVGCTDIDDCSPNPCLAGTCTDGGQNVFTCDCDPGFTGPTCSFDVNECLDSMTNSCVNGTCLNELGTYSCLCDAGWSGDDCDVPVDCGTLTPSGADLLVSAPSTTLGSTATYTCDNGKVISGADTRTCQADGSWSGSEPTCIDPPNGCNPNPCENGGTCNETGGVFDSCTCQPGYSGSTCGVPVDCGALGAPTNGSVNTSGGTSLGSTASYSCSAGYSLSSTATRTCQPNGNWSGTEPTCDPVDCGSLSAPTNGNVSTAGGTTLGDDATYTCNAGYTLVGSGTRTCQATGNWSGSAPSCQAVDCGGLSAPTNGSVDTSSGTTFGEMASYACDLGYTLVGPTSRTCQSSGNWSGADPSCQVVDCGGLNAPTNGSVDTSGGTTFGEDATYSCSSGYTLNGNSSRTCQASGGWSGTDPTCDIVSCPMLTAPSNGSVSSTSGNFGDMVTYSCDSGYTLSGNASRTCQSDGSWTGTAPSCSAVDCGSLSAPADGSVDLSQGTGFNAVASFSCDAGYDLNGSATRTCQASGMWSNSSPTCTIRDCGSLTNPTNGSVSTSGGTTVGETATYSCDSGFQLNGSGSRTCGNDGNWTGAAPTCDPIPNGCDPDPCMNGGTCTESGGTFTGCINCDPGWEGQTCTTPVDCGGLSNPSNGSVDTSSGTTFGEDATYSCNAGYTLNGSSTRSCQASGNWSGSAPTCDPVDCGSLSGPTNGSVDTSGGTELGDTASYSCNSGYTLNGSTSRTCGTDGNWSGSAPTCDPVDCGGLSNPSNGSVDTSGGTEFGDSASYSCNSGYTLSGSGSRSCQANGTWSGSAPTCVIVDCGSLSNPSNGTVDTSGGTEFGDTASYSCNSGYTLNGGGSRSCQANGSWSGSAPTCDPVDCGSLSNPSNGTVDTSGGTEFGDTASYSCDSGYTLSGSSTRTCNSSANWSGSAPTCNPVDCGSLTNPSNGSVDTSGGTEFGDTATYSCNSGYTLSGSSSRTCQANGSWSTSAPTCNPVDCGSLSSPSNGSVSFTTTTFGSVASYSCDSGYSLNGNASRTCQSSGSWSGSQPTCESTGPLYCIIEYDAPSVSANTNCTGTTSCQRVNKSGFGSFDNDKQIGPGRLVLRFEADSGGAPVASGTVEVLHFYNEFNFSSGPSSATVTTVGCTSTAHGLSSGCTDIFTTDPVVALTESALATGTLNGSSTGISWDGCTYTGDQPGTGGFGLADAQTGTGAGCLPWQNHLSNITDDGDGFGDPPCSGWACGFVPRQQITSDWQQYFEDFSIGSNFSTVTMSTRAFVPVDEGSTLTRFSIIASIDAANSTCVVN